jgi:short-subunit dehydrogenase
MDASNWENMRDLAERTADQFGRIDVWINNAAVTAFGRLEALPPEVMKRVVETNILGYMYGTRAVIPYMREQRSGVIINVSSVAGTMGQAYTSVYVATKFAIRGFSESLRQELLGSGVEVSVVLPGSTDTPLFQHGANYAGRAARPMEPIASAEDVARVIVQMALRPKREVFVTRAGRVMSRLYALFPALFEPAMAQKIEKNHFSTELVGPTQGNLFEPITDQNRISGGWLEPNGKQSVRQAVTVGAAAVLPLAAAGWAIYRRRQRSAVQRALAWVKDAAA